MGRGRRQGKDERKTRKEEGKEQEARGGEVERGDILNLHYK